MESHTEQPFRLLGLPPELRLRIYECHFEDGPPQDIDLLAARQHAPTLALAATCRLIRQEVSPFLPASLRRVISSVVSNPPFPISALDISLTADLPCTPAESDRLRATVRVQDNGQVEVIEFLKEGDDDECENGLILLTAENLRVSLKRRDDPRFLHIGNILRAVLAGFGWHIPPIESRPG
ncbi:hypothetical protein B0A55_11743 [Friedmanniomyces simplex]|uniref:F-box domain-containing protein n=1 Tax=Friedmanniomyces simplex TaxID=329884 RepID=A0A4U0VVR2_9PEZI|nr:hypothetical protein B0A55_11743 [Friedmanniomyces simplex]